MSEPKLVKVDKRSRVSLGDWGVHGYYFMSCDEVSGEILLQPAVVAPLSNFVREVDGEQK